MSLFLQGLFLLYSVVTCCMITKLRELNTGFDSALLSEAETSSTYRHRPSGAKSVKTLPVGPRKGAKQAVLTTVRR